MVTRKFRYECLIKILTVILPFWLLNSIFQTKMLVLKPTTLVFLRLIFRLVSDECFASRSENKNATLVYLRNKISCAMYVQCIVKSFE